MNAMRWCIRQRTLVLFCRARDGGPVEEAGRYMMTSRVAASRWVKSSCAGASASGSGASGTREYTSGGSSSIVCGRAESNVECAHVQ